LASMAEANSEIVEAVTCTGVVGVDQLRPLMVDSNRPDWYWTSKLSACYLH